jgi:hypothetical protein
MSLNEDYLAALETLAVACDRYRAATGGEAVLVGGAATAILTDGAFMSGDFDLVAPADHAFETAMLEAGFLKEHRPGFVLRGFYHPDHPDYGFEPVSGQLFDGKSDTKGLSLDKRIRFRAVLARRYSSIRRGSRRARC